MSCKHEDWDAYVAVNRLTKSDDDPTVIGMNAEVKIWCRACNEPAVFIGAPIGMLATKPCISPDGTELRAPLRPQSEDPAFGMGIAGFSMRVAQGAESTDN